MSKFAEKFGYWVGLISGLFGIADLILAIVYRGNIPAWFGILFAIVAIISLIFFLHKCYKYWKNTIDIPGKAMNRQKKELDDLAELIHEYFHKLRDVCMSNSAEIQATKDTDLLNICNKIQEIFTIIWGNRDVCVCVKYIIEESAANSNVCDWEIKTLERSSNSTKARRDNDEKPVKIGDNSDFKVIITPGIKDTTFICSDLSDPNFKKRFYDNYGYDYRNSTDNYLDNYKATMVVPIRHKTGATTFNILGFLCVDTKKPFDKAEEGHLKFSCEYLMATADILYLYLHKLIRGGSLS